MEKIRMTEQKVEDTEAMRSLWQCTALRTSDLLREHTKGKATLQAELVEVMEREKEAKRAAVEDVGMGGTGSPSEKIMVDATTMTEVRTYAQVAAQTQAEVERGKRRGRGRRKTRVPTHQQARRRFWGVWRFRLISRSDSHLWRILE